MTGPLVGAAMVAMIATIFMLTDLRFRGSFERGIWIWSRSPGARAVAKLTPAIVWA